MTADELAVWQAANPDGDLTAIQAVTAEFGCVNHQLSLDLATMLHQSTCSAPNVANLPQCDCAPQTYGVPA
jgi:hypothetical protein